MKKLVVKILIMCLLITQISGYCKADVINYEIEIMQEGELPFYYQGQNKKSYQMLKTIDEEMLYLINRTNVTDSQLSQEELYEDEQFEKIVEYGYPNKSIEEIGVNNEFEAYVATQEALYIIIEDKDINLYYAENEQGQRIIDAISNIIVQANQEDIHLIEQTTGWVQSIENSNNHYKEYKVVLKKEIDSAVIQTIEEKNCQILNQEGQTVSNIKNNDIIRVVVPKNIDQTFLLHVDYTIMQPVLYMASTNTSQTKYIINRLYQKDKDYRIQIENKSIIDIIIRNYKLDTNEPLQGNTFKILDENKNESSEIFTTDENGKIETSLRKGKYYLKQINTIEGELQKELVPIEIKGTEQLITLNIYNTDLKQEEQITNEKEINVTEENKIIQENYIKDIMNINTTNLQKEIINQTNETNLNNINHFINNINKRNILNLTKENYYRNNIQEQFSKYQEIEGKNLELQMNRNDYKNYIDDIKIGTIDIPNLPVASHE